MEDIWKEFANDFKNMSDEAIKRETEDMQRNFDEAESWLEAVASWERAGRPR